MRDDTSTAERSPERVLAAYRRFPVIYIAGPYTAGDPAANVHRAVDIAHYLMDHGLAWPPRTRIVGRHLTVILPWPSIPPPSGG